MFMRAAVYLVCLLAGGLTIASAQGAGTSLVIWPVVPTIAAGTNTTALWLENRGSAPVTLQIRVVEWTTIAYDDMLVEDQDDVIASPPVAEIAPGRRQLVRLLRIGEPPVGREQAFRVIVDELPSPAPLVEVRPASALGVNIRLRYSLPLFVYGDGLVAARQTVVPEHARVAVPDLEWRVVGDSSQRWLHVRNTGSGHARLSHVRVTADDIETPLSAGLLGYVLPGAERRWALPPGGGTGADLRVDADVNGRYQADIRPRASSPDTR